MTIDPSQTLKRHYHGCTIYSVPDGLPEHKRPEGSDGWLHALFCGDVAVSEQHFHSLAAAIKAAREVPSDMKAQATRDPDDGSVEP